MFFWIYDIPTWQLGLLFAVLFVGITWAGIFFVTPFLKLWLKGQEGINDLVGYALSGFGVFYGLLLGLLAVATYQNSTDVSATVSKEAASLGALYRDISAYPEPVRTELTGRLRTYTEFVIKKAWPSQRKGEVPQGSVQMMDDFQRVLTSFEPTTKGQELLHGEALRQYNDMILLRRQRIQSIGTGIPGVMWYVVGVGAVINTLLILCFRMRLDIHLVIGGALSFFVGVLIFLVAAMDYPFRGEVSIGPEPFQLIYTTLMSQ
ncbi:MAG: hypothetical protein V4675_09380 [Verrucomicrobiota bacterium]